ncbi:sulfatase-like hydrolase/transferase [Vibrio sp. SCSIO 43136]|uniref:sulfatase-like hydrolase/transferase n=1 Tax=Vibrio sp. SCSIO 43136 TaxID=2819101 RepID=UPI002075B327|nr:sulfatase-like hydrolase/transferase [Vibrio sp. SCSIO 43136]USD65281.1 sulfatase-like hydrolase/transferase [Vibrio sp. SCSIO 43136]
MPSILRVFKSYPVFALIYSFLVGAIVVACETAVRHYYEVIPADNPLESFFIGTILALIVCFSGIKAITWMFLAFIGAVYLIQFGSIATYGFFISPIKLWLLFEKFLEVLDSGKDSIAHSLVATLCAVTILASLVVMASKANHKKKSIWASALALVVMLFYPIKQIANPENLLGIKPYNEHSAFKSALYTLGYFSAHTIPQEVFGQSNVAQFVRPAPERIKAPEFQNIVFVMGESLSSKYVGALGFEKNTTPWLAEQAKRDDRYLGEGFSGGLFTDVSLPYFFQSVVKPNGTRQIAQSNANLFKMAKEQGYTTHFYSAQTSYGLSLVSMIGRQWIDHYDDSFSITHDGRESVLDMELLNWLKQVNLKDKNFIVLHQMGSHMPYSIRTPKEFKKFGEDSSYNEYLNSVYYTDELMKQLQNYLEQNTTGKWSFIMTSDHGQYVTANASGHGSFSAESNYLVPVYIASNDHLVAQKATRSLGACSVSFQVQLSDFIANQLGFDFDTPTNCDKGYVAGASRSGDSGYLEIIHQPDGSTTKELMYK